MKNPEHSPDIKREQELRNAIEGGAKISSDALPYLKTRGYVNIIRQIQDLYEERRFPFEAEATARITLALPNTIAQVRNEHFDASICSKMHGAIGDLIESCEGTNLSKQALINRLMLFCRSNALILDGSTAKKLEEQLSADITGVWHEHGWENLLLASGVNVERANVGDDLNGTDLWVEVKDNEWVSVDVKAQPFTVKSHAAKRDRRIISDYFIDASSYTAPEFSMYVAATNDDHSAYVAFDSPPGSGSIAPIDFRGSPAIDQVPALVAILKEYALNGTLRTFSAYQNKDSKTLHFRPNKRKRTQHV